MGSTYRIHFVEVSEIAVAQTAESYVSTGLALVYGAVPYALCCAVLASRLVLSYVGVFNKQHGEIKSA